MNQFDEAAEMVMEAAMMAQGTRCTCGAGHSTYGACLRSKNISIGQVDRTEQKKWDQEISAYREARRQGVQPRTTQMADVAAAMEISDRSGRAFDGNIA